MTVVTVVRVDMTASSPGRPGSSSDDRAQHPPSHDLSLSRGRAAGAAPPSMLRLRESRDVRLLSSTLETTPTASVSWTNDVFGNAKRRYPQFSRSTQVSTCLRLRFPAGSPGETPRCPCQKPKPPARDCPEPQTQTESPYRYCPARVHQPGHHPAAPSVMA